MTDQHYYVFQVSHLDSLQKKRGEEEEFLPDKFYLREMLHDWDLINNMLIFSYTLHL